MRVTGTAIAAIAGIALFTLMPWGSVVAAPKPTSPPTLVAVERPSQDINSINVGYQGDAVATCNAGETVIGGGFRWGTHIGGTEFSLIQGQQADVVRSSFYLFFPLGSTTPVPSWRAEVFNTGSAPIQLQAYAMCARIQ
jgi:hypothetical protein